MEASADARHIDPRGREPVRHDGAPQCALKLLVCGRSFHDPLGPEEERYEPFGHIRYFTCKTPQDYVRSLGFVPDSVCVALPAGSSTCRALYARSRWNALSDRYLMWARQHLLPPGCASERILWYQKVPEGKKRTDGEPGTSPSDERRSRQTRGLETACLSK